MKKIILISPPSSNEIDFSAKKSVIPPEGLCLLASCIRNNNYQVSIIDSDALGLTIQEVIKEIKKQKPNFIGITSTTVTIHNCSLLAKKIRESFPDLKIIIGGPHITVAG
ncbi:MAG: cobalamin B12-binding domain-containing protein, partial [Nanoarchaeota archaeon]|nr:cobalamin B12-binding domain-containing protein [Nanoarchaeota archaeon]